MIKKYIYNIANSKLSRDILYVFLGQIAIMLSVFGINKIISYYMGVESFAVYNLIKRAGGLLYCITAAGLTVALPRYCAKYSGQNIRSDFILTSLLASSLLISTAYSILISLLSYLFPKQFTYLFFQNAAANYLLIFTVLIFAFGQTYRNLLFGYYQGIGNFKKYNIAQLICSLICLVCAFYFRSNLYTMIIISYTVLTVVGVLPLLRIIHKNAKPIQNKFHKKRIRRVQRIVRSKLIKYGTPRMAHDLMIFAQDMIPLGIILYKLGTKGVALYSAGLSIPLTISPLFEFTGGVFLQRVTFLLKQNEWQKIHKMISIAFVIFLIVAIFGSIFLILARHFIVTLMFSDSFYEVIALVPYFALSILPRAVYLLYRNPLDAVSVKPYNLYSVSIRAIILIVMLLFATSIEDCAKAYLYSSIALVVFPLLFWWHVSRQYKVKHLKG